MRMGFLSNIYDEAANSLELPQISMAEMKREYLVSGSTEHNSERFYEPYKTHSNLNNYGPVPSVAGAFLRGGPLAALSTILRSRRREEEEERQREERKSSPFCTLAEPQLTTEEEEKGQELDLTYLSSSSMGQRALSVEARERGSVLPLRRLEKRKSEQSSRDHVPVSWSVDEVATLPGVLSVLCCITADVFILMARVLRWISGCILTPSGDSRFHELERSAAYQQPPLRGVAADSWQLLQKLVGAVWKQTRDERVAISRKRAPDRCRQGAGLSRHETVTLDSTLQYSESDEGVASVASFATRRAIDERRPDCYAADELTLSPPYSQTSPSSRASSTCGRPLSPRTFRLSLLDPRRSPRAWSLVDSDFSTLFSRPPSGSVDATIQLDSSSNSPETARSSASSVRERDVCRRLARAVSQVVMKQAHPSTVLSPTSFFSGTYHHELQTFPNDDWMASVSTSTPGSDIPKSCPTFPKARRHKRFTRVMSGSRRRRKKPLPQPVEIEEEDDDVAEEIANALKDSQRIIRELEVETSTIVSNLSQHDVCTVPIAA